MQITKWRPLVSEKAGPTHSFELSNLFYPALFGGLTALGILSVRNAKTLQMDKQSVSILQALFGAVFIMKALFVYMLLVGRGPVPETTVPLLFKLPEFGMFVFVYFQQLRRYRIHKVMSGNYYYLARRLIPGCLLSWIANLAWWLIIYEWVGTGGAH